MDSHTEKYLNEFQLQEPPPGLKERVIAAGKANWYPRTRNGEALSASFIFRAKIFFSSAAIILLSIMVLNSLSYSRPEIDIVKYKAEIEQMVKFGISREKAVVIIAVREAGKQQEKPKQKISMEENPVCTTDGV